MENLMYQGRTRVGTRTRNCCSKPHKTIQAAEQCAKGGRAPFHPRVIATVLIAGTRKIVARWQSTPAVGRSGIWGRWEIRPLQECR